jgi:hypothetical protein
MISVPIRPLELTLRPCDSVRALCPDLWQVAASASPTIGWSRTWRVLGWAWRSTGRLLSMYGCSISRNFAWFFSDRSISYSWPRGLYVTVSFPQTQCRVAEVDQV